MVGEDVIDENRQVKNFRRTNTFRKSEPILLVTFGQVKIYLGKFMFALQTVLVSYGYDYVSTEKSSPPSFYECSKTLQILSTSETEFLVSIHYRMNNKAAVIYNESHLDTKNIKLTKLCVRII